MEDILKLYDDTLKDYNRIIVDSFSNNDFREYNEILFSAHSCAIEGNTFSVNDTRELKEKGLGLKLQNKSLLEAYEILDHFSAYEFIYNNLNEPLTEDFILKVHTVLTKQTIKFTKGSEPGTYTDTQMGAGDTVFGDYKSSIAKIPELMELTQKAIDENKLHPVSISARFHQYFIYLHPFPDGNGRLGRLISNFILAKFKHPNIIIEAKDKTAYIEALKASHKHRDLDIITSFFASTAINRMKQELADKKNLTQNFIMNFEAGKNKKGRSIT